MELAMKLFGLACLLGGLLLMREQVTTGLRSANWPAVPGTVVAADRVFMGSSAEDGEPTYHTRVEYSYEVDGRGYRGSRVEALPSLKGAVHVSREIEAYPVGSTVDVYFDPDRPSLSLLVPGLTGFAKLFLAIYLGSMMLLAVSLFVDVPHEGGL